MLEHLLRKKQIPYFKRNGLFTRLEAIREALKGKKEQNITVPLQHSYNNNQKAEWNVKCVTSAAKLQELRDGL